MQCTYKRLMSVMTAASLLGVAGGIQAQDQWGAPAEEPEVQAQDPWGAEPAQPEVEAQDPWAAQPVEPEPAPQAVQPTADPAAEMQQIQMQLQQISMQLQQVQQQALQVQEVMDAFEQYEAKLRARMLALSPEAEEDIRAAEELVDELRAVEDPSMLSPEEAQEFQAKYMEFQQAAQRLQPIEQQASMDPEMQEASEELESKVMDAMRGVDPQAESMLDQHEQLIERYIELEQQQQQRQMQQQQMAPHTPEQEEPAFEMPEF